MAEKTEKSKELTKAAVKTPEKSKQIAKPAAKAIEKARQPEKKTFVTRVKKWWRETIGELRKVTWPTPQEAWRLTKIVLAVMAAMAAVLGLLDLLFSFLIGLILA